jgi:hypothetical protein
MSVMAFYASFPLPSSWHPANTWMSDYILCPVLGGPPLANYSRIYERARTALRKALRQRPSLANEKAALDAATCTVKVVTWEASP